MSIKFFFVALLFVGSILPAIVRGGDRAAGDPPTAIAATPEEKIAKPEETKLKGRLPQYYSKLGVTDEQRQKIYSIQNSYAAKIDGLEKQLGDAKEQRDAETRSVLTVDQQKKLYELVSERKAKKSSLAKATDIKRDTPAASDPTKISESPVK